MEADWSVEIGRDLPVIEGSWRGFVDLRRAPERFKSVEEAGQHPALRDALLALNGDMSPLFTTKCDAWPLAAAEIDADEFASSSQTAVGGFACYIDVLDRDAARFASFEFHERRARVIAAILRKMGVARSRAEIVVRRALLRDTSGYGLTLYAAGCGGDEAEAYSAWNAALGAVVAATIAAAMEPSFGGE